MSRPIFLGLAFVLLLAAYPLTVLGGMRDGDALLWAGLAALAVGGLIPPLLHFAARDAEGETEDGDGARDRPDHEGR